MKSSVFICSILLFFLFTIFLLSGETLSLQQRILSNADKLFGTSIASDGDTLIVGSQGNAHVFRKNSSEIWEKTGELSVNAPLSSVTVALNDTLAVVGVPDEKTIHIFERADISSDVWSKVKTISRPYSIDFAYSVAVTGDAVFVGAPRENASRGALYIFEKNSGGADAWGEKKKMSFSTSRRLGVALSADGDRVVVGTRGDMIVYLLERDSGGDNSWGIAKKILMPFSASFGTSLAIDGDTIAVGAPSEHSTTGAVYIFEKEKGGAENWGEVQRFEGSDTSEAFAQHIALKDGVLAVATSDHSDNKNRFSLFRKNGTAEAPWTQGVEITYETLPMIVSSLVIEKGVVFAGDAGSNALNGRVFQFKKDAVAGSSYQQSDDIILYEELDPQFASLIAISGDVAIVASPVYTGVGSAYIFQKDVSGSEESKMVKRLTVDGDISSFFGRSIAIDGDTIVVGAFDPYGVGEEFGHVFIFERNQGGENNWGLTAELPNSGEEYAFGFSVLIKDDVIFVGSTSSGSVFVFERDKTEWVEVQTLHSETRYGELGFDIAFNGTQLVVAAPNCDGIYIFEKEIVTSQWQSIKKIETGCIPYVSLALNSDTLAFGRDAGYLFLFGKDEGGANNWGEIQRNLIPYPPNRDVNVALDETKMVVTLQGDAYLFTKELSGETLWKQEQKISPPRDMFFSETMALEEDTILLSTYSYEQTDVPEFLVFHHCPTNHAPTSIVLSPVSVEENMELFTTVGVLSTVDIDNEESYSYSVVQSYNYWWDFRRDIFFVVDGDVLKTASLSNAEIKDQYNVIVRTEDSCGGVLEKTLVVDVNNAEEIPDYDTPQDDSLGKRNMKLQQKIENKEASQYLRSVVVGNETIAASFSGGAVDSSVHVFYKNRETDEYAMLKKVSPSKNYDDSFGWKMAFDEDTLVVNSYNNGMINIYERNRGGTENWGEVKQFNHPHIDYEGFSVMTIQGDTLVVGAYRERVIYIFERNQGGEENWGVQKRIEVPLVIENSQFGFEVALSGDTLVVADRGYEDHRGVAYVFERNNGGAGAWGIVSKLTSPSANEEYFGAVMSIDKNEIIVASEGGFAHIFQRNKSGSEVWGRVTTLACDTSSEYPSHPRVAIQDGMAVVAYSGRVCLFGRDVGGEDQWGKIEELQEELETTKTFGSDIAMKGTMLVVVEDTTSILYFYRINSHPTDITLSNNTISKEAIVGTTVGTLSTIDADPDDSHTYTLLERDDSAFFFVTGDVLKTKGSFDISREEYSISIEVDDGNGGVLNKSFTIFTTEVDEDADSSDDDDVPDETEKNIGCSCIFLDNF